MALMFSQGNVEVRSSSRGDRRDLLARELPHHLADLMVVLVEVRGSHP